MVRRTKERRTTVPELDREDVLAHRAAVQDLVSPVREATRTAVSALGLQDTPRGSGLLGIRARTTESPAKVGRLLDEGGPLVLAMTVRGVPHVLARSELAAMTAAVYPFLEAEADAVDEVAGAIRKVVRGKPIARPDLSGALNDKVSDALRGWCERCGSRHVHEDLFRKSTLQAGLAVDPEQSSPVVFVPHGDKPSKDPDRCRAELVRRFVHLVGATRPGELAGFLGYRPGEVKPVWNLVADELTEVVVNGQRRWVLSEDLDALRDAPRPEGVRLLPPSDPYLLGDRSLVVPDRDRQRQVWRAVANPGVVLAAGEIVGTWRHRMSGRRLSVTVAPFGRLGAKQRSAAEAEAHDVAAVRGIDDVEFSVGKG